MTERLARPPEVAREVKLLSLDTKSIALDGVFEGYASLFNREDLGHDIVMPGAFRDSIAERGAGGVKMLFQHDPTQPIGKRWSAPTFRPGSGCGVVPAHERSI